MEQRIIVADNGRRAPNMSRGADHLRADVVARNSAEESVEQSRQSVTQRVIPDLFSESLWPTYPSLVSTHLLRLARAV